MEQLTLTNPLATTLARVMAGNDYLQAVHGQPEGEGWRCPATAFAPGSPALRAEIARVQANLRSSSPNIVGCSLLQGLQWPLIHLAAACYGEGRVPDVEPEQVWLQYATTGKRAGEPTAIAVATGRFWALPDDPDATHPDATVVPDRAALRARLRELVSSHFAPMVALLCRELGCAERGLWLAVADGLAGTVFWLQQEREPALSPAALEAELDGLVRVAGSPLFTRQIGLFTLSYRDRPSVHYDRATCCYWYKTEGGDYCTTCPKRPRAERDALLLKYRAEEEATRAAGQEVVAP